MHITNGLLGTCSVGLLFAAIAFFSNEHLHTSDEGIMLIIGYESCRLTPYRCSAGKWTDGVGNTFDVVPGQAITETEAARDFINNLAYFEKGLGKLIKVDVSQNVWDSLVSFSYNVGLDAFNHSTLLKKLNAGDTKGACNELPKWIYSNGKRLRGLMLRRQAEKELCLGLPFTGDIAEFEHDLQLLRLIDFHS